MSRTDEYGRIAREFWRAFKEYAGIKQDSDKWELLVSEFDLIAHNALGTEYEMFARRMYLTFLKEIERLSKK